MNKTVIPIGDVVLCDMCNADFTNSTESGGFLFVSNGVCPDCAKMMMPDVISYHEEHHIRARCPEGKSFADFIRELRGPDAAITITSR